MKQLLLDIIKMRKHLIHIGKSRIDEKWATDFMIKLSYWINNGGDVWKICGRWDNDIRTLMSTNFIKKYEQLLSEHTNSTAENRV